MIPKTASADARRRKRPRVFVLLTTIAFGILPSVASFGLSSSAALPTTVVVPNGALTVAGVGFPRRGVLKQQQRRERRIGERRGKHQITCRVASPRRYGSADWFSNIQNLPKSRLLYNIKDHLLFNTAFAFLVSMVHLLTPQHVIDDLHVSAIPHSIMSGALGLLLVFRTNAAYNRFWEARKVWGSIINTCRNIARLSFVALGPDSEDWVEMKEYIRMFPYLLKQHLQDVRVDEELDWVSLPEEKVLRLQEDPNPPILDLQIMTEILARAYSEGGTGQSQGGAVPDFTSVTYRMEIEKCLSSLMDDLGKCERILTTPVPRGYSRHTSRFLTVYGFTLPIVLVPHTELFTAPVVAAVCWGLFSIEEIAYFIEQPFDAEYRQLDMMAFSEKVARDIDRMTASSVLGRESPRLPGEAVRGRKNSHSSSSTGQDPQRRLKELGLSVPMMGPNGQAGGLGGGALGHKDGIVNGKARGDGSINGHDGHDGLFRQEGLTQDGSGASAAVKGDEGENDTTDGQQGEEVGVAEHLSEVERLSKSWHGDPEDDILG